MADLIPADITDLSAWQKEPLYVLGGAAIASIIGLFAAFGFTVTDTQANAIKAVGAIVIVIALVLYARKHVTPNAKVAIQTKKAVDAALIASISPPAPATPAADAPAIPPLPPPPSAG